MTCQNTRLEETPNTLGKASDPKAKANRASFALIAYANKGEHATKTRESDGVPTHSTTTIVG